MLRAITPQTRVIFVANPEQSHRHFVLASRADLLRLVDEVPGYNVLLALDEAYIEFMDDPVDLLCLDPRTQEAESA